MSTGADCFFVEKEKGEWHYSLQQWPYGENPDYDEFGPFPTFHKALKHLDANHANPGGYSVEPLPGCPHDLVDTDQEMCNRCGSWIKQPVT